MALASTAAALAGSTALAAYLNAKHHLSKDLSTLLSVRAATKDYEATAASGRRSLWYSFEESARRLPPSEPAIWSRETGDLSYAHVYSAACRYANWMREDLGVRPGDLVAFYLINSAEMVIAFLATWAIGAAPSMINYNLGGDGLVHCLSKGGPKVVLVDEDEACVRRIDEVRERVEGELGMRIVRLGAEQQSTIMSWSDERPPDELRKGMQDTDPVILLFTSGTTGFPKASRYHVSRVAPAMRSGATTIGAVPGPNGTRFYDCMPLYHGTGFTTAIMCLGNGMCVCVGRRFSASTFWDEIRDSRATAFVYVGETARYLLAAPPSPRDRAHAVRMMFGNGLRPDVWARFRERFGVELISEFFNSTEGVLAFANSQNRGDFTATAVGHHGLLLRLMTRNLIIPVAVSPEDNSIVRDPATGFAVRSPYPTGGEILVRVPGERVEESGFAGYFGNAAATAQKFERDVFARGDLFFRSGDSLRRDADGRWYFLDRLGDTFRWKSENVSTAEVADVLGRFDGVVEANVYGVLVPQHDGRAGCAAVFLDADAVKRAGGRALYFRALLEHLRAKLPRYAVPVFLRVVDAEAAGPQMHNNKQNKVPLRNEGVDLVRIRQGPGSGDAMYWATPDMQGFEAFGDEEWASIDGGRARL